MKSCLVSVACAFLVMLAGCATAPQSQADRDMLEKEANLTIEKFKKADPGLQQFYDNAAGYAVFPLINKGGWLVGGAYGRGMLYERTKAGVIPVGYVDMKLASIGLQWGGQSFSEIIFLENQAAVTDFKYGKVKPSASISAVAAQSGSGKAGKYSENVAIFTLGEAGLMVEGAVGGQKFGFMPKPSPSDTTPEK
jgi:lipid-binding SYLF domain-containing protein